MGVTVLFHQFHRSDPINDQEILAVEHYVADILKPLFAVLKDKNVGQLIGASGTFDVLEALLGEKGSALYTEIRAREYQPLYERIVRMTYQERLEMPGMPTIRADMIVVALVLVRFVMERASISKIMTSAYALQEGMLVEMLQSPSPTST